MRPDLAREDNPYAPPESPPGAAGLGSLTKGFKRRLAVWVHLVSMPVFVALPAACVTILASVSPWRGNVLWLFTVPAIMVMLLSVAAAKWLADLGYRRLARRIATQLTMSGRDPVLWGGEYVKFAPSDRPCYYVSQTDWDNGYLFLFDDRLTYVGDQTEFSIPRDLIVGVQAGREALEWPEEWHVYVDWRTPASREVRTLSIWLGVTQSTMFPRREIANFADRLQDWLRTGAGAPSAPPAWAALDTPDLSHVENLPAHRKLTPVTIVGSALAFGAMSGVLTAVLGTGVLFLGDPLPAAAVAAVSSALGCLLIFSPRLLTREVSYSPSQTH